MSSSGTDELAQRLVLRVDGLHAGQVQQGVEQHRGVAHGEHEAVAVRARWGRPGRSAGAAARARRPRAPCAMGVPGWPELACCTASIASVRIVLMESKSRSDVADIEPCMFSHPA